MFNDYNLKRHTYNFERGNENYFEKSPKNACFYPAADYLPNDTSDLFASDKSQKTKSFSIASILGLADNLYAENDCNSVLSSDSQSNDFSEVINLSLPSCATIRRDCGAPSREQVDGVRSEVVARSVDGAFGQHQIETISSSSRGGKEKFVNKNPSIALNHITTTSGPGSFKNLSKCKRVRTIFTPEQLERLEAEFERQQYMVGPERLYLAHTLQLSEAQVKVWFQNRRIKWRKHHLEMTHQRLAAIKQQHKIQQRLLKPSPEPNESSSEIDET